MCRPASMIVLKGFIPKWSLKTDSHSEIVQEYGLCDTRAINAARHMAPFVGVEIVPPYDRFDAPPEQWKFIVDENYASILPDWWEATEAEKAVRAELLKWIAERVVLADAYREVRDKHVYCFGTVTAMENSTITARDNSTVKAMENSTITARDNSTVTAWDNSTVTAWGNSTVKAMENSRVTAMDNSRVTAMDNSTVDAWEDSTVEARDHSTITAPGNSTITARENSTVIISSRNSANVTVRHLSANAVTVDRRQSPPVCIVGITISEAT